MSLRAILDAVDESHLRRALQLAEEAAALASPNPTVGCVIAKGDQVLGEGAHFYDNFDHAEIEALKQAALLGHDVHGATAYVTLEPCAHHGRTPPCANALIAAGIARCVIATLDPNPLVGGAGVTKLKAAGITVDVAGPDSPFSKHARALNDAFAWSIQHNGMPFVTLKAALSAEGSLAPPPSSRTPGTPHWLTGPAARADVQQLRHTSDAILTGIGTILADNPSLTDRTGLPRRRPLLRVILDPDLRVPLDSNLLSAPTTTVISTEAQLSGEIPAFSDARSVLIFCAQSAPAEREHTLIEKGVDIIRLDSDSRALDLNAVLTALASRKIISVLVEAGSTLNGSLLHESLVQKLILYLTPTELGPGALPFANGIQSPLDLRQPYNHSSETIFPRNGGDGGEDIRVTVYFRYPWWGGPDDLKL